MKKTLVTSAALIACLAFLAGCSSTTATPGSNNAPTPSNPAINPAPNETPAPVIPADNSGNPAPTSSPSGRQGRGGNPPQAMVSACQNLAAGASCTFTGFNNQTATGTCAEFNNALICRGSRSGGGGRSAQARISACQNLAAGASCTFTGFNNQSMTGTCAEVNNQLLCQGGNRPAAAQ